MYRLVNLLIIIKVYRHMAYSLGVDSLISFKVHCFFSLFEYTNQRIEGIGFDFYHSFLLICVKISVSPEVAYAFPKYIMPMYAV